MPRTALWLVAIPLSLFCYAYLLYPLVLWVASRFRARPAEWPDPETWPTVTITVPCYNEERSIAGTIESLLALDYPRSRLQILIISDASTDRTDEMVQAFSNCGVELLRLATRGGKTAAENAAGARVRGELVVNTDATTRIQTGSLKELVRVFQDPTIGVATGRAIAAGDLDAAMNRGEATYTNYEMWVRGLETRVGTIVGASGCFFASRRALHAVPVPEGLSRDFASCLVAHEHGFRAVSVPTARCLVPLSSSVRNEFRRKARTMARGLDTLWFKRSLLNPATAGTFAFLLFSHKLARWLFQLTLPLLLLGLLLIVSSRRGGALIGGGAILAVGVVGWLAMSWPESRPMPRLIALPGYAIWSSIAGSHAWLKFLRGQRNPIWEPTRRPGPPIHGKAPAS